MNTIQEKWELFHSRVIPITAPDVQVREMRRAFYSGVEAMLQIQWEIGGPDISESAGIAMIEGIHDECRRFADEVAEGTK